MRRKYGKILNGKKIEFLAPSETMETFKSIVVNNCDAIYLADKSLNMRMDNDYMITSLKLVLEKYLSL